MDIARKSEMQTVGGAHKFFTVKATITAQFPAPDPPRISGTIVHFAPGARTNWHTPPAGQTLIVTEGVGWMQVEADQTWNFVKATPFWCPDEHRQWHGATPHEAMTHKAIQEPVGRSSVTWMEKVTDEQYLAPVGKTDAAARVVFSDKSKGN